MHPVNHRKRSRANIALLGFSLTAIVFFSVIPGCGEDDSNVPEVIRITPEPGTWILPSEQFTIQFNVPIIPASGSITLANRTYKLPQSDVSDTITWNRCWRVVNRLKAQLIVHDFQDVDGRIQATPFEASYPAYIVDPAPPGIIEHHPSGSHVNPATTREIRVTFNRPMLPVEFKITPPIDGTPYTENIDDTQCVGIARWVFADTEQLSYATEYQVQLYCTDTIGSWRGHKDISFTTRP